MGEESEDNQLPSDEEAVISDEEEERGSSAEEEGSGDEEEDDEEGSEEEDSDGSPSARRRPVKKPFVAPPPRALPQRTTRGARIGDTTGEEGDEEFWNQEFFAEEENDERYDTESEPEDRFDVDFDETEDEGNDEEEAAEAEKEAVAKEKKKKVLKPPGYKKPPLPKPKVKQEDGQEGRAGPATGAGAPRPRKSSIGPEDFTVERRAVRDSTRQKVEEGEMERKLAEKYKPRRAAPRSSNYRPLTQAELLAEAAKTEVENIKSLELLVLIEEEARKKAQVVKRRYAGPMVRCKSRRVGDTEVTTLEVRNMAMPDELRHRVAPAPAPRSLCAVTGQPARYRDPATGMPYATIEAYRELKRRKDAGLLGVLGGTALPGAQQYAAAGAAGQQAGEATGYGTRQQAAVAAPAAAAHMQPPFMPMAQPFQQQGDPLQLLQSPLAQDAFMQQQQAQGFFAAQQQLGFGGIT